MCGIAGYYVLAEPRAYDPDVIHSIHDRLNHRGPDGYGTWTSPNQQVVLLHKRLSIIDVSNYGSQPMTDETGSIVIVFNGEIYNHIEIRAILKNYGHIFRSQTDTEILIYAYKQWGIDCLQYLEGMFAFALYDAKQNTFFLVRDRIGIKPLYFSLQQQILSFASEIKALWPMPWISKHINAHALFHYLSYLATPAPMTFFEGIYKVPPGFYVQVDKNYTVTFHQWYNILNTQPADTLVTDKQVSPLHILLADIIKKHSMADVASGVLLSGGLDSSLLVALLAQHVSHIKTFTITYPESETSQDVICARTIAQQFGTEHHEVCMTEDEAFELVPAMLYHQDEPLGDMVCVPLYYLSHFVQSTGIKVIHVGEGADELFCGYPLYMRYVRFNHLWQQTQRIIPSPIRQLLIQGLRYSSCKQPMQDLIERWGSGRALFNASVYLFSDAWKRGNMQSYVLSNDALHAAIIQGQQVEFSSESLVNHYRAQLYTHKPDADLLQEMLYIELMHRLPELLLMRTDKMTMAHSIESRVPFLDHRLVEYAFHQPQANKLPNYQTKFLLKKISESLLPYDLIHRPKVGFSAPANAWFRKGSSFSRHLLDLLASPVADQWFKKSAIITMLADHHAGRVNYAYHLWAIYNFLVFAA